MSEKHRRKIHITDLLELKRDGAAIVAVTAYDYPSALLVNRSGAEIILVGDSLGTVVQGNSTTIPVTLDQMIYHTQLVVRAADRALVVADMPFLSFQVSPDEAVAAAGRLIKEGGAAAVKLEGGAIRAQTIRRLTQEGIPVMGHIGLLPQSYHASGGYKVQGRKPGQREQLLEDSSALEQAGAFAVVLEGIPAALAAELTASAGIPTIGIGAGAECSGQILVFHDLLGFSGDPGRRNPPKFVKQYADLDRVIGEALSQYGSEVRGRRFPAKEQSYE